jgi:hypothetical protein
MVQTSIKKNIYLVNNAFFIQNLPKSRKNMTSDITATLGSPVRTRIDSSKQLFGTLYQQLLYLTTFC